MLLQEIFTEAIQNRPRNMRVYLTKRIQELGQMLADLEKAKELIEQGTEGDSILRYAIRSGIEGKGDEVAVWHLEHLDLDREFQINRLKESLESYLKYGNDPRHDFLRYVMSTLADVEKYERAEYREQYALAFSLLPYVDDGLRNYGFEPGNPEHEVDPEYIAAKKLLAGYRIKAKVFDRIIPLENDMRAKLGVIQNMKSFTLDPHKYKPEHEEVEALYHASAFVPEILRDGFSAERPVERVGVGNFGHQNLISFTHDLEIARNIMRSFKEIWMIAHGRLTGPQIMSWAKSEGIEDDLKRAWKNETSDPMPGRDANPKDVVKLYRNWLFFTKLRENPMIVSPWEIIEMMKDRKLSDIGVVECEVRLDPKDEYLHGESEFRLLADRVLSVKRKL